MSELELVEEETVKVEPLADMPTLEPEPEPEPEPVLTKWEQIEWDNLPTEHWQCHKTEELESILEEISEELHLSKEEILCKAGEKWKLEKTWEDIAVCISTSMGCEVDLLLVLYSTD